MSLVGWYPLALSRDIAAGTSAGVRVEGHEYVVWRDTGGAAHIWEDRCPHRGMKLSFGFVRGDYIACLYHGWRYDGRGQCIYVPAHPDLEVPDTIKVPRFPVSEAGGIVWGCFEAREERAASVPDAPDQVTPARTIFADCPETTLVDRITRTPFDGATPVVEGSGDRLLTIKLGDLEVLAASLAVTENESALHLLVAGPASPEQLKQLARWAVLLRRGAEAKPSWKGAEIAA